MTLIDLFLTSLSAMKTNLLRTFLTMLGIIIGVGAVIILTAATEGAQQGISDRIGRLGRDLLFIHPRATQGSSPISSLLGPSLFLEDQIAIDEARYPYIEGITSLTIAGNGTQIPISRAIYRGLNVNAALIGSEPSYQDVKNHYVESGRFISEDDVTKKALVVVLGPNIAERLFGTEDPIGQTIRVQAGLTEAFSIGFSFTVIGVMEKRGAAGTGDEDDRIFVPLPSFQARIPFLRHPKGYTSVNQIHIRLTDGSMAEQAKEDISIILRERHDTAEQDFQIETQSEILGTATDIDREFGILVFSIALIALIVGGIGIMNIMLVSVTERTREIGIRKAIGARRTDILMQFLTEAILVTIVGGALGVGAGVGIARALDTGIDFGFPLNVLVWSGDVSIDSGDKNYLVTPLWIVVGLIVSAATGVIAGVYPAWSASRLDPIEALRHE
jgi:putative ABC transport system permease protein